MSLWTEILKGGSIFLSIWLCKHLINEDNTDRLAWLFQPIFFIGLLLMWTVPIDWSINNWIVLLIAFSLSLADNILSHFELERQSKELIDQQSWWQIGPLRLYRAKDGYIQASTIQDNAYTSRFGTTVLGVSSKSSLWNKILGDDGWTDSQRRAILRHEYGHNIAAIPIIFLETLLFYWFYHNASLGNALVLIPVFITAWTLVNWLDELLADTVAGHHGFSLLGSIFKDASFLDYVLGGVGDRSHPPLLLRCLAFSYAIPVGAATLLIWTLFANSYFEKIV